MGGCRRLLLPILLLLALQGCKAQQAGSSKVADGNSILDCGELNNLYDMSRCLSKRIADVKAKSGSRGHGYPYSVAPPLPPYLRHDDMKPIVSFPERRYDKLPQTPEEFFPERRIHRYSVPRYRNSLDLDIRPQVLVFSQPFTEYDAIPSIVGPPNTGFSSDQHMKPVKVNKKTKKAYGYDSASGYYDNYSSGPNGKTYANKNYKLNAGFSSNSHHSKQGSYDREYYVPANHPIIGDIRRSLMEYTGARDLLEDEPDYLGTSAIKRHGINEIQNDYYSFRRSGLFKSQLDKTSESQRN